MALAAVLASLGSAGCTLDTSTPSGWQSHGPRSSASLPAPDPGPSPPATASVAEE
jgi:hypothetical protein